MFKQDDLQPQDNEFDQYEEDEPGTWHFLGYLDAIAKRKDCPFCRLVVQSRGSSWPDDEITSEETSSSKTPTIRIKCSLAACVAGRRKSSNGQVQKAIKLKVRFNRNLDSVASVPQMHDGEIKLSADDANSIGVSPLYHGRLVNECIDLNLVRGWIQNCKNSHISECGYTPWEKSRQFPVGLRLIDVKRMCVIKASNHAKYIALSYVWGNTKTAQLTTQNKLSMEKISALSKRTDIIGRTILDAIQLVDGLEERYLWCDQLCIVQDDLLEKSRQISQMGLIYSQALFSIIAAGGDNADAPLPGLRPGSRSVVQHTEVVNGLRLIVPFPMLSQQLNTSIWNTRAWTFQERLLSRRSLIFTSQQVYFDCRCDSMQEDVVCERASLHVSGDTFYHTSDSEAPTLFPKATSQGTQGIGRESLLSKPTPWPNTFASYSQLIETYSSKNFTYPEDILRAFSGAQTVLQKMYGWSFSYGLPEQIWDHALLWRPKDVLHRRVLEETPKADYQSALPTYSWAAWTGPVTYRPFDLGLVSKVDQFELYSGQSVKVIKRTRQKLLKDLGHENVWGYDPPILSKPTVPRRPQSSKDWFPLGRLRSLDLDPPTYSASKSVEWLQFWASSALMRVSTTDFDSLTEKPTSSKYHGASDVEVSTRDKYPGLWIHSIDNRKAGYLWKAPLIDLKDGVHELILLSQSRLHDSRYDSFSLKTRGLGYDGDCMLNVMLIRWREDFAERITIGRLSESAWSQAAPKQKLIKLI